MISLYWALPARNSKKKKKIGIVSCLDTMNISDVDRQFVIGLGSDLALCDNYADTNQATYM